MSTKRQNKESKMSKPKAAGRCVLLGVATALGWLLAMIIVAAAFVAPAVVEKITVLLR